jgi:hypothetical protein
VPGRCGRLTAMSHPVQTPRDPAPTTWAGRTVGAACLGRRP